MEFEGNYYLEPTENARFIEELLQRKRITPHKIESVVGAGWPVEFKEMFPGSAVYSFDSSSDQIRQFRQDIKEVTGNYPILVSVTDSRFTGILESRKIDFLFLSNILDYLDTDDAATLGEDLGEVESLRAVLFSTLGERMKSLRRRQSVYEFAESLTDSGFHITKARESYGNREVTNFFLASRK